MNSWEPKYILFSVLTETACTLKVSEKSVSVVTSVNKRNWYIFKIAQMGLLSVINTT